MKKLFIAYGTVICVLFAYQVFTGKSLTDDTSTKKWSPQGHSMHHK